MRTRLLSGGTWVCGKTIVPEGLTGPQLSFNFTVRYFQLGGKDIIYLERTRIDHFKQNVVIGLERKEKKEWWT